MATKEIKIKKGLRAYNYSEAKERKEKPYKPKIETKRVFNEKTESYEYETKERNYKLEWEETENELKQLYQIEELVNKGDKR